MGKEADIDKLIECVKEMNEAEYVINTMLLREFQTLLEDEITTKQALLLEIVNKRKSVTVREIADSMQVSSSAISQIVSKLEKSGYVKREINVHNRREILVLLDEEGVRFFAKHDQVERAIIERFYAKLDFEDVELLNKLTFKLKKIVEAELSGK
ncbi:MarR family winged helix-turn-helix transcriptional regulator [Paenibacillus contaminans]|uniref:MarR family transcriptional regulator n=1 Tax=Paenibacillus contaminans TaxID=450362 RepID=A0A329MTK0_9BACL|nr:MarR family transcriptional regulator [Paenibacillus contaminans]RAV22932.1 MarR family transcriptional regulator [Paenibacillus contaminans]